MKTIIDIEQMKKQQTNIFGNAYNYLIESLANFYISKTTYKERIQSELDNWEPSAQEIILCDVKACVESSGLKFEWN